MKQKLIRSILVIGVLWELTGCAGSGVGTETAVEDDGKAADEGQSQADEPAEDVQPEDGKAADEETEADEEPEGGDTAGDAGSGELFARINRKYYEGDNADGCVYGGFDRIKITADAFPELTKGVDDWFNRYEKEHNALMRQYAEDCKSLREEMGEDSPQYNYDMYAAVQRLDSGTASFSIGEERYTGGAHGMHYLYGVTFDSQTGEEIAFEDLGDIKEIVAAKIDETVAEKREKEGYSYIFYEDAKETLLDEPAWYLDSRGLQIVLNEYEIGAYAESLLIVSVPYDEMEGFNEKYRPKSDVISYKLQSYAENRDDFDMDGKEDVLRLETRPDEYDNPELYLTFNDSEANLGYCADLCNAYYIQGQDGRKYVTVSFDEMSDDYMTCLLEIKDNELKKLQMEGGYIADMIGDRAGFTTVIYVLGTYVSYRSFKITDGAFVPVEERFEFDNSDSVLWYRELVLKAPLKVMLERDGIMTEEELSEGTKLYPVNTDNESVVGFMLEDGVYGELQFEREEYELFINGVSEQDIFEYLPYAG